MKRHTRHIWVHLALSIAVLLIAAPILFAGIKATQDRSEVLSPRMLPGNHFIENISVVWNDQDLGTYIGNSLWIALSVTIGKTALSILAAMVLVYFHIRFKGVIFGFVLFTLLMPTEVLIVGLFDLVSLAPPQSFGEFVRWVVNPGRVLLEPVPFGFGWTNRYASIIVPFMASATGIFLFRQHFLSIPRDLGDAARIDGAGPWNFLVRVLIPLSGNTIGALALIQFVYVWDQYLWPRVIIRDDGRQVVQVGLRLIIGVGEGVYWGQVMAGSLISIIPPLVVFITLQEQFMRGFALTADK